MVIQINHLRLKQLVKINGDLSRIYSTETRIKLMRGQAYMITVMHVYFRKNLLEILEQRQRYSSKARR